MPGTGRQISHVLTFMGNMKQSNSQRPRVNSGYGCCWGWGRGNWEMMLKQYQVSGGRGLGGEGSFENLSHIVNGSILCVSK